MRSLRQLAAALVLGLLAAIGVAHAGSGYTVNGVDLDSIFAPEHAGWPQASATGFKINGVDIDSRYAPLSTGSAAATTGFKVGGVTDLNAIFAAYGSTGVQVAAQPNAVSGSVAAGNPSGTVTSNTTSTAGTKGGGSYTYTWHLGSGPAVSFTAPNSAVTAVTGTIPAGTTYSGTMYNTISDGVTSVNTNSVSWSLQNTSPATLVRTYTGSDTNTTETVPAGYTHVTIEAWGSGGSGEETSSGSVGGAGGGAYVTLTIAVAAGNTFTWYGASGTSGHGQNGVSTTVTGTVAGGSVNIAAFGGRGGSLSAGGAGGSGSGGTVTNGASGTFGSPGLGGAGANGGAGGNSNGAAGTFPGGGGAAGIGGTIGGLGAGGQVRFTYF